MHKDSEPIESHRSPNKAKKATAIGTTLLALGGLSYAATQGNNSNPRHESTPTSTTRRPNLPTTSTTEKAEAHPVEDFKIIGNEAFQSDINAALKVIKDAKDQTYWFLVQKFRPSFIADPVDYGVSPDTHVVTVNDHERHYIGTDTGDPKQDQINELNNKRWLSGSIVHEAFIGDYLSTNPSASTATAENLALYVQGQFLTDIHADSNQVNFVNNEIDPTDSPASYWNRYKNAHLHP